MAEGASSFNDRKCYNCGQTGHMARNCTEARAQGEYRSSGGDRERRPRRCFNCGRIGHLSADCTVPAGNKACYNCGEEGHISKDCTNPRKK